MSEGFEGILLFLYIFVVLGIMITGIVLITSGNKDNRTEKVGWVVISVALLIAVAGTLVGEAKVNKVHEQAIEKAKEELGVENAIVHGGNSRKFELIGNGKKYEVYYDMTSKDMEFVEVEGK